jgi:hypothetical protein
MDDIDLENIPQTGNRRGYRRLKADNSFAEETPESDPERARQKASRLSRQAVANNPSNPFLSLLPVLRPAYAGAASRVAYRAARGHPGPLCAC